MKEKKLISKFVDSFLENNKEIEKNYVNRWVDLSQCSGEMRGFEERAKYMIENAPRALKKLFQKLTLNLIIIFLKIL